MQTPVIDARTGIKQFQRLNRQALANADVLTIDVIGGPGCGKTTLIETTLKKLAPEVHVGVVACDLVSHWDADRMSRHSGQVVQVNTGEGGSLDASQVHEALNLLDLNWIDLLFIENTGSLIGATDNDVGQDVTVAIFSVAAGDDKAGKHPNLVRSADVVLLNKVDLLARVPFDLAGFRGDVRRLNDRAEVIEISGLHARGIERWIEWLRMRLNTTRQHASHWFG